MHTFTKRIEDKKNQSNNTNNNKKNLKQKSLNRRTQSKIGDKKNTSHSFTYGSTD